MVEHMRRTMVLIGALSVFGGMLTIVGLLGPWVYTPLPMTQPFYPVHDAVFRYHAYISPFSFTLIEGPEAGPGSGPETMKTSWFYKFDATLIGLICMAMATLGIFGTISGRKKVGVAGGVLSLLACLMFISTLPEWMYLGAWWFDIMYWRWGMQSSFIGALCIVVSSILAATTEEF